MSKRKPAKKAIAALHALNWMIRPESLRTMLDIASRENVITEALETKLGQTVNDDRLMTVRDGVATIYVEGPLFRYANLFTRVSGATAYATLATDLQQALEMPNVRAILLSIDSPGGEVNGAAEFADMVYAARGKKPIVAYIGGDGCSAAYWIASAADVIVAAETAIVGCIGTVATLVDESGADEMMGIRRIEIVSSQTPKKRPDPTSGEAQAQVQAMVDDLAQIFIESLARNRAVGVDTVLSDFGEGGVFVGAKSIDPGLVDRIGSYEQLHAELSAGSFTPGRADTSRQQSPTNEEDPAMSADSNPKPAVSAAASADPQTPSPAPGAPVTETEQQRPDPAPPANDQADGSGDAAEQAARAERERIAAITSLGRAGEESLIASCIADPKCSPAEAALRLRQAESTTGRARLRALAGDDANLDAPGPNGPATDGNSASAEARRIIAAHQKVSSPNRSR